MALTDAAGQEMSEMKLHLRGIHFSLNAFEVDFVAEIKGLKSRRSKEHNMMLRTSSDLMRGGVFLGGGH